MEAVPKFSTPVPWGKLFPLDLLACNPHCPTLHGIQSLAYFVRVVSVNNARHTYRRHLKHYRLITVLGQSLNNSS